MNKSPIYEQSSTRRMPIKHNWDIDFSPEVHVLAGTLHPRCVDQHLVVRQLRGVARTSSSVGHRKNLPTSEVTQWHEQSTRVTFRSPPGKVQKTSHNHWEMATSNHQLMSILLRCSKPSRWRQLPRVTRKPQLKRSPSATRCNHSSKYTWNHSQSHKDG